MDAGRPTENPCKTQQIKLSDTFPFVYSCVLFIEFNCLVKTFGEVPLMTMEIVMNTRTILHYVLTHCVLNLKQRREKKNYVLNYPLAIQL